MEKIAQGYEEITFLPLIVKEIKSKLSELAAFVESAITICDDNGLDGYARTMEKDADFLREAGALDDFWAMGRFITDHSFPRLPAARGVDSRAKNAAMTLRNTVKDEVKRLKETWFFADEETALRHLAGAKDTAVTLSMLVREFADRYAAIKSSGNVMDFSDLEHEAGRILTDEDGDPTDVAVSYAHTFREIMVDEYQDTNFVQENILNAILKGGGDVNIFMVGDVKQSIYGFRQARPALFMKKYSDYGNEVGGKRVLLSANFRSRRIVLDTINDLFCGIMKESFGGIEYDDAAALKYGDIYNTPDVPANATELLITEGDAAKEAKLVASRIYELLYGKDGEEPFEVQDSDTGVLRRIRPGDIAILLRSATDSQAFSDALMEYNIASFTPSKRGYFSSPEIQVMLSYLSIIDNPRQDIPLAAVLKSDIYGFSPEELSDIRLIDEEADFYEASVKYAADGSDHDIKNRLMAFFEDLNELRELSLSLKVRELIEEIFKRTRFDIICAGDAMGERRSMNLRMLLEKAGEYEKTSYTGIFDFNRYIEELHSYELDYGQAVAGGNINDMVGIYTIHKSKGLEYPVVFVSQCCKEFNFMDLKAAVIPDDELGVGLDDIDLDSRTRNTTLPMAYVKHRMKINNLAEEMRVLYVALTRAMEKLIITGATSDAEEYAQAYESGELSDRTLYDDRGRLSDTELEKSRSYMTWIAKGLSVYGGKYNLNYISSDNMAKKGSAAADSLSERMRIVREMEKEAKGGDASKVQEAFGHFRAPLPDKRVRAKYSVSEIKLYEMQGADEEAFDTFSERELSLYVPSFAARNDDADDPGLAKGHDAGPAAYGTAVHRILEILDFSSVDDYTGLLEAFRGEYFGDGAMSKEELSMVRPGYFRKFIESDLYRRMQAASRRGELKKERSFVMSIPASEADPELPSDKSVLVQGIIDAYFIEDGKVCIVDYKTDRVSSGKELADRYRTQMELYAKAVKKALGAHEVVCILYSFCLNESILLA